MNKVKIIWRFFNKTEAQNAATAERQRAAKEERKIERVEIICACKLFRDNNWYGKRPFGLSMPEEGQFMIIVHYDVNAVRRVPSAEKKVKKEIKEAVKKKEVAKKFKVVRLSKEGIAFIKNQMFNWYKLATLTTVQFYSRSTFQSPSGRYQYHCLQAQNLRFTVDYVAAA